MSVRSQSDDPLLAKSRSILYLSGDGILEPLGASQVTSYVLGLSRAGYSYQILSLEKPNDLADLFRQQQLERELAAAAVRWTPLPYEGGSASRLAGTYWHFFREARRLCKAGNVELLHARSYLMSVIARRIYKLGGPPYLFDARGYWVDERAEAGRWFKQKAIYRSAKSLEHNIARDAAAIVTLTDLQRDDFRALFPDKAIETITTCVDFDRFQPGVAPRNVPATVLRRLEGKLVVGLIGSINSSYKIRESIQLFRALQALQPEAHLLCLTRQEEEIKTFLSEEKVAEENFTIASAPHSEIHEWMPLAHWGLLLLESSPAKRASMPTKLGEMLAAGVRPVQYGCNVEVGRIVHEAGSGLVLPGLSEDELRAAARQIVAIGRNRDGLAEARELAFEYFSLVNGTRKYAQLLAPLMRSTSFTETQRAVGAR